MTNRMNPGAYGTSSPKFERSARQFMDQADLNAWRALDSICQGSKNISQRRLAEFTRLQQASHSFDASGYDRTERKANLRRAKPVAQRLANDVKRALDRDDPIAIRSKSLRYFLSFDVKYHAYSKAFETMKKRDRPHIGLLQELAASHNAFELQIETAELFYKSRATASPGNSRVRDIRPLLNFKIRNRAQQQMVLKLLQTCFGNQIRQDQYCTVTRGREHAVRDAAQLMQNPFIEFVAECDITNFFPSVGENNGQFRSIEILQDQLIILPRAVIENTVLASGIIAEPATTGSLEALNQNTYARTGMPQGSALSSYLAELIMSQIMLDAETLVPRGTNMITYVDNIGLFGETADEVNGMIEPLSVSARNSSFGSFDLRRSQTTRHKSQGFIFLGYYLKSDMGSLQTQIEVSDRNKGIFQERINHALSLCHPACVQNNIERNTARANVVRMIRDWVNSFRLAPDILDVAREIVFEALPNHDRSTERYFRRNLLRSRV